MGLGVTYYELIQRIGVGKMFTKERHLNLEERGPGLHVPLGEKFRIRD